MNKAVRWATLGAAHARLLVLMAAVSALVLGCESEPATVVVDEPDPCDQAPVTTWDNFGGGFLLENCASCHAKSSLDRHEAPLELSFDTPAEVSRHRSEILAVAAGLVPVMPPAGGVPADDRARLLVWLSCDPLE